MFCFSHYVKSVQTQDRELVGEILSVTKFHLHLLPQLGVLCIFVTNWKKHIWPGKQSKKSNERDDVFTVSLKDGDVTLNPFGKLIKLVLSLVQMHFNAFNAFYLQNHIIMYVSYVTIAP